MSPPRRRSARLASAGAKSKAVPELSSVAERDECPAQQLPKSLHVAPSSPRRTPATPSSSALKPPRSEMHPSKFHPTTGEPSSALRLGFSDIKARKRDSQQGSGLNSTPTKIGGVPSSSFTFHMARQNADTGLSGSAQRMMDELREEAAKIKADLVAQREAEQANVSERAFAKPKGKSRRFSATHMAEFKKMDSIEGHASAWRAKEGRFTPVKSNLKRSPSKANLDVTPSPHKSSSKQSLSKTELEETQLKPSLKRTSSVANLDSRPLPKKTELGATLSNNPASAKENMAFPTKRHKQCAEDDASTARPASRDGSSIPRPTFSAKKPGTAIKLRSGLSRLMSPTKSSMADHTKTTVSLVASSPKSSNGNLSQSTDSGASSTQLEAFKRRITSPSRFQKVKSIIHGHKLGLDDAKTAIPQPVISQAQAPAPPRINKALPPVPLTTPRRKLPKNITFTPETVRAAMGQDSPSPQKLGVAGKMRPLFKFEVKEHAGIDSVLANTKSDDVVYPDLTGLKHLIKPETKDTKDSPPPAPGTFTFRSDHTIQFGSASPSGFGASPGQASVRHVRGSIKAASDMPSHLNKEKPAPSPPTLLPGAPHGMSNKRRHRAGSDDSDAGRESTERAGKKRKNEHVRPLGSTPKGSVKKVRLDGTPACNLGPADLATPSKKRPTLSVSRLNMLARPKNRV